MPMPFDAGLAERLQEVAQEYPSLVENRMFGGFGYMLYGNMCVGIHKDTLIVRVGVEASLELLKEEHVRPMDLTGRVMKGWATVEPEALDNNDDLARYLALAIAFVETLPIKG